MTRLVYYGNQQQLEYDFILAPRADPNQIAVEVQGASGMELNAAGNLVLHTAGGDVVEHAPVLYQETATGREAVAGSYVAKGPNRLGFRVGGYDRSRPLVIDPVVVYSTYLGGNNDDRGYGIAVDGAGNAYVTGGTTSSNFPTTPGAFQRTHGGGSSDAFVAKLNAAGSGLVYSTFLGGGDADVGQGVAVDGSGNAHVTGQTRSPNFPTTGGAFQRTLGGIINAFVTKLNAAGSALLYSTFLGGSGADYGFGIAVDASGYTYVTGSTTSSDFPTTVGAFQRIHGGEWAAFVAKLNTVGSGLFYSTYLGSFSDALGIAVDGGGNAYVTGRAMSSNFPTTPGAFQRTSGRSPDAFVAKLNPAGSALVYSTFLGGSGEDIGFGIAVDGASNAYVTGYTDSSDFPTTAGAFQGTLGGGFDAFVAKLNAAGSALRYSTYLGGSSNDYGTGIAVDGGGNAYVTGYTQSRDFPTTGGGAYGGSYDAFVTKIDFGSYSPTHFAVSAPSTATAGTAFAVTVTALNAENDPVPNYTGQVHFTGSDPQAVLPPDYTFTAADHGVHTFMVTLKGAGSRSVTVVDTSRGSLTGSTSVTVSPAAAATLLVGGFPTPTVAGTIGTFSIIARDAYGNVATGYRGTVHFSSGDPRALLPSNYAFTASDDGMHTFTATLKTAGTQSLTATDTVTATLTGTQPGILVSSASAGSLMVSGFPQSITAGVPGMVTVTAQDLYGNTATGYRGTVHLISSDPRAILPTDYTLTAADNGRHIFTLTLCTAGTQSITVTDTGNPSITGTQGSIVVNPGLATTLAVVFPPRVTAGTPGTLTVTAKDACGNVATSYRGTIQFTSTDPQAMLPGDYTFAAADNGTHTFTAVLRTAHKRSLTATDTVNPSLTGTQSGIHIHAADAATLEIKAPDAVIGATSFAITVTARDPFQNRATYYRGSIHFTSTDPRSQLPSDYTFAATDAGRHTFRVTLNTLGNQIIMAQDTLHSAIAGSTTITVTAHLFDPPVYTPTGRNPDAVAVGDFNGDGIPDLVVANSADNTVRVLLGNGDGTFRLAHTYVAGLFPPSVAVADLTGTGMLDIVTANRDDDSISVLLGNGDGTFRLGGTYTTGLLPVAIAVGDFNGDGIPDLITADSGEADVTVLLGNGDGTFGPAIASYVANVPAALAVGDFNGDGVIDVVTANPGIDTASVLLGNGDGTFQLPLILRTGMGPDGIAVGDFNGDGALDFVVANANDNTVSVFLGDGDGTFQSALSYTTGQGPTAVAVGDFNRDGILDLAVANGNGNNISMLLGNGDGSFQAPLAFGVGTEPVAVAVSDFNGDGWDDLAVADFASNDIAVLLNAADWPAGPGSGTEPGSGGGSGRQWAGLPAWDRSSAQLPSLRIGPTKREPTRAASLNSAMLRENREWAVVLFPYVRRRDRRNLLLPDQVLPTMMLNPLKDEAVAV